MIPRVGDIFQTNNFGSCIVVEYNSWNNIRVRFEDGTETSCIADNLRKGLVKNPNHPIICGIGFIGIGNYSYKSHPRIYDCWDKIFDRCYNEDAQLNKPTYIGCTVCERWWNFQNFAPDYLLMVGSDKSYHLDKDLYAKDNKVYSPEKCCLLPPQINIALIYKSQNDLEPGVSISNGKVFRALISIDGQNVDLGYYSTEQEAFLVYKSAKEDYIKELSNRYKNDLDSRAYKALMIWEI